MSDGSSLHSSEITSSKVTNTFSSTSVPLFLTSAFQDENQRNPEHVLPKTSPRHLNAQTSFKRPVDVQNLPSHRFRFSVWHDVAHIDVTGDRLRAPRVRGGPPQKEALFYRLRDENDRRIHHTLQGRERTKYQSEKENWESAQHVNLSYQELEHDYQRAQLLRVLKRLPSAEKVVLINNELVDMSSVSLPMCVYLDLTMNHLLSFQSLPSLPKVRYLKLAQNAIHNFGGLRKLRGTPIQHLILKENPIAFTVNYRKKVFEMLPQLVYLDGMPRRKRKDGEQLPESANEVHLEESEYLANKSRVPPSSHPNCAIL